MQPDVSRSHVSTRAMLGVVLALCACALAIPAGAPARSAAPPPVIVGAPVAGGLLFKVTITGTYGAKPCAGRMRLTYRARGLRTVRRLTTLSSKCHYTRTVRLRVGSGKDLPTTLRVDQRFMGNRSVPARRAQTVSARLVAP